MMKLIIRSFLILITLPSLVQHARAATPAEALVYISFMFEFPDGTRQPHSKASGFLVTEDGVVVTAKHAVDIQVPATAKLVIEGRRSSIDNQPYRLYPYDPTPTNTDIATLRFSGALGIKWPFLKLAPTNLAEGTAIVAWGFPLNQERISHPGVISGPTGITATLLPMTAPVVEGMSGGPVVDSNGAVVGVVTGGGQVNVNGVLKDVPLQYLTPVKFVADMLKVLGAQVVSESPVVRTAIVEAQIEDADDDLRVFVNGILVQSWETDKSNSKKVPLRTGENPVQLKVYNKRSFTGGLEAFGGHQPEGWRYSFILRTQNGASLLNLHDGEDRPPKDGPRHGHEFIAATFVLNADAQGNVTVTQLQSDVWQRL